MSLTCPNRGGGYLGIDFMETKCRMITSVSYVTNATYMGTAVLLQVIIMFCLRACSIETEEAGTGLFTLRG